MRWLLWRRGPIVLVCVLITAGSAYAFARRQTEQYQATASLLFSGDEVGPLVSGLGGTPQPPTQSQLDTNVQLVGVGDIAAKTAAQFGRAWSAHRVKSAISVSASSDTSIVDVTATAPKPAVAQILANTYAKTFVAEQQQRQQTQIAAAEQLVSSQFNSLSHVQRAGAQGLALVDREQSLQILAKLENGNVSIAGLAGRPTSPASPAPKRDAVLGGLLGLLIGLAVAFTLERTDRRIRDPKGLAAAYELPLLATVPQSKVYNVPRSLDHSKRSPRSSVYDEVFNLLWSHIRYLDPEPRTLLVISADPGEGKTTVVYNLANAAAALGSRVLVVEADLRHGSVIAPLFDKSKPRLPDVLVGDASMEQAVRLIRAESKGQLEVLVAGRVRSPKSTALIDSSTMTSLLEQAVAAYDLVVIDTPPLSLVADAVPLLGKVDGVIVVGRMGKTRRDTAEQLRNRLMSLRAPVLGVVANGVRGGDVGYRHLFRYYGYGYEPAEEEQPGLAEVLKEERGQPTAQRDVTQHFRVQQRLVTVRDSMVPPHSMVFPRDEERRDSPAAEHQPDRGRQAEPLGRSWIELHESPRSGAQDPENVANHSLTARPLDGNLARDVLDQIHLAGRTSRPPSIGEIQTAVATAYSISVDELVSAGRAARIAWPRQVAIYLARDLTHASLNVIGEAFGGRNRATVLHACKRVTDRVQTDPEAASEVQHLVASLERKET